jgi:hypothetical protein
MTRHNGSIIELGERSWRRSWQSPAALTRVIALVQRAAAAVGLKPAVTDARRATMLHVVDCIGLTRVVHQEAWEFERALGERREWCEEHCPGQYVIEPLGPNPEELTGRRFRFLDENDAALFIL